jgi:hypothetical protein
VLVSEVRQTNPPDFRAIQMILERIIGKPADREAMIAADTGEEPSMKAEDIQAQALLGIATMIQSLMAQNMANNAVANDTTVTPQPDVVIGEFTEETD